MAEYKDVSSLEVVAYKGGNEDFDNGTQFILEKLDEIPTADVVEVVRCKDCKHATLLYSLGKYMCKKGCGATKVGDDFCSYGTKMDEGEEV